MRFTISNERNYSSTTILLLRKAKNRFVRSSLKFIAVKGRAVIVSEFAECPGDPDVYSAHTCFSNRRRFMGPVERWPLWTIACVKILFNFFK